MSTPYSGQEQNEEESKLSGDEGKQPPQQLRNSTESAGGNRSSPSSLRQPITLMGVRTLAQETPSTGPHHFAVENCSSRQRARGVLATATTVKPTPDTTKAKNFHVGAPTTLSSDQSMDANTSGVEDHASIPSKAQAQQSDQGSDQPEQNNNEREVDMSVGGLRRGTDGDESSRGENGSTSQLSVEANQLPADEDEKPSPKRKRAQQPRAGQSTGRWTPEEHQAFLEGLKIFGREWKKVAERIPTRTSAQIRSHAQKYFAKLAREESMLLQEHGPSVAAPPQYHHPAIPFESAPPSMNSSLQRNVDRILASPANAQREVEETLRQLRERYRQLQIRLEESTRRRGGNPNVRRLPGRIVENDAEQVNDSRVEESSGNMRMNMSSLAGRKRLIEDSPSSGAQRNSGDDVSSISSSVSTLSRNRDLGNEELIALHVLGDSLSRSSSHVHLPQAQASEEDYEGDGQESVRSSPSSSIASTREASDGDDCSSTNSKRAKLSGGTSDDDNDSSSGNPPNDQIVP